jgi:glycolate oxidase FAD binding subunit
MNSPTGRTATTALEPALRRILGDALATGDAAHAVDGLTPRFVATPSSVDDLAHALALANEHGASVVPRGGGRHMALGNIPQRYDIALRTTALDRILEYEPADLTVTVEGGITFGKLQAALAERGQFLPIDAPPDATVGGVLAANVSGPSRHAYGLPRDWLIGTRVAHAAGTVSKGGGRVVKNVAGYDMPKLYVGSLGTLGVIVEATFKVAPLPAAQETLIAHARSFDEAATLAFAAEERGLALRAVAVAGVPGVAALRASHANALVAYWLAGTSAAVERTSRELDELIGQGKTRSLEGRDSTHWWASVSTTHLLENAHTHVAASLSPSAVVEFVEHLQSLGRRGTASVASLAYPTTGLVQAQLAGPTDAVLAAIEQARAAGVAAGGSLVVHAAPPEVKQRVDVWGPVDPATFELMRRLKAEFDPKGTLNPGRFVGGL